MIDQGKAPLLSLKAVDDLHIFIFVLAVAHVVFSALTILFGGLKVHTYFKITSIVSFNLSVLAKIFVHRYANGGTGKILFRKENMIQNKVVNYAQS